MPHSRVVLFGSFEVDLVSGELRKGGVRLKLPEQSFRVLEALLEQPGEIVSREELQQHVWNPGTHVSFERSLNTIVHTLRVALGDSARNPRFIETVHGRGYRLLIPVRLPSTAEPQEPSPVQTPPVRAGAPWLFALGGLAAAAALVFWLSAESPSPPARADALRLPIPVTSYVGMEAGPAYSPDGSSIAFHWDEAASGSFDIYVKEAGNESSRRLTSDPADDLNPAWSPDGELLAFVRRKPGYRAAILLLPREGGAEREIVTIDANGSTLSWSADGRWIAYSNAYPDYLRHEPSESGVMAVEVATGKTIAITRPEPLTHGDTSPALSPGGGKLAFVRGISSSSGDIYVLDVDDEMRPLGAPRQITKDAASFSSLAWSADGRALFFVSNRSNVSSASTLWRLAVDAAPGTAPVSLGPSLAVGLTVSPRADEIVFAYPTDSQNLWRLESGLVPSSRVQPNRITHSTSINRGPALSPDATKVAFESNRSGLREIWVAQADGSHPEQVSSFDGPSAGTPQWAPDGKRLALDARVEGAGDIFVIDIEGGEPRRLTDERSDDIVPSWSRDGRWVYFASNRTGRYETWKVPAEGGEPVQITRQGGFHARESVDGGVLYYAKSITETSLWSVPVDGGEEAEVLDSLGEWANFSPAKTGIFYFSAPVKRRTMLHFFDFASGSSRPVHEVDAPLNGGLTASSDGRTVIFSRPEPTQSDLMALSLSDQAQ